MAASAAAVPTSTPARSRSAARRCGAGGSNESNVPRASNRMVLGCAAMEDVEVSTWIGAGAAILVAIVLAAVVDRAFRTRAVSTATAKVSREGATRLRFVRRLIVAGI